MVPDRAVVFATCVVDTLQPSIVDETIRVLRRWGVRATPVTGATCCGQPAANSGLLREARRMARPTLRSLADTQVPIVVPSGSCTSMIRQHWPDLFARTRHSATALSIAARTFELTEFLSRLEPAPRSLSSRTNPAPIAYHASCHLNRHLDVRDAPRRALSEAGYDVRETDDGERCCGFGGTFTRRFARLSQAMADEKLDALAATGASVVTGCDLSCLAHLETRARQRGDHDHLEFAHIATRL